MIALELVVGLSTLAVVAGVLYGVFWVGVWVANSAREQHLLSSLFIVFVFGGGGMGLVWVVYLVGHLIVRRMLP